MEKHERAISALVYLLALIAIQWFWVSPGFPIDEKLLWLANGAAGLILGSRLLHPHFIPPADVAANAFFAGATMVAALAAPSLTDTGAAISAILILILSVIFLASLGVLILKREKGLEQRKSVLIAERLLRQVGQPKVVFTVVMLATVWFFHASSAIETFVILAAWTAIVALEPVEAIQRVLRWVDKEAHKERTEFLGHVAAHQAPGLILIRQDHDRRYAPGTLMAISDPQGPTELGVALNYVGRDDGVLLRALSLPSPPALKEILEGNTFPASVAVDIKIDEEQQKQIEVLRRIQSLCGIVDIGSTSEAIEIEVVTEQDLSEGRLVNTKVGSKRVIYQIIGGVTHEEAVQQKNKYGYVRAKARKVGTWDRDKQTFIPVPWLPQMNAPVFMEPSEELALLPASVGHFPETNYQASIDPSTLVTHNTAILGILGIGKSFLALELVDRMIAAGTKVICLDLTDQYAQELSAHVDAEATAALDAALKKAGKGRIVERGKEEGGSIHKFQEVLDKQIEEFLSDSNTDKIRIINPASILVWRQTINAYKQQAAFSALTPSEITALVSDAALKAAQKRGMTDQARVCLVYEEAHSLVPEWNSVASDGDKNATAATARAILQGRKFGLGCLLITQRTANVTKSILNQCNTIFAMRIFDDTGMDFLSNYIGKDYAEILPTLQERHAVLFGKASSCDDPVLLRLNDREKFKAQQVSENDSAPVAERADS